MQTVNGSTGYSLVWAAESRGWPRRGEVMQSGKSVHIHACMRFFDTADEAAPREEQEVSRTSNLKYLPSNQVRTYVGRYLPGR